MDYSVLNIIPRPSTRPIAYQKKPNTRLTLFGNMPINRYRAAGTQQALDALYEDFVPREVGLLRTIDLQNKLGDSLSNPSIYLYEKNTDLEKIGRELVDIYKNAYSKVYNKGKTVDEAKKYAQKYTETYKKIKLDKHNEDFPPNLVQEAVNKLKRRNRQGNLIF